MKISFFESSKVKSNTVATAKPGNNAKAKFNTNEKPPKCDGNKLTFYFKSLLIAFSITIALSFLLISNIDKNINKKENSTDYVSVFKESDLYEILFTENE